MKYIVLSVKSGESDIHYLFPGNARFEEADAEVAAIKGRGSYHIFNLPSFTALQKVLPQAYPNVESFQTWAPGNGYVEMNAKQLDESAIFALWGVDEPTDASTVKEVNVKKETGPAFQTRIPNAEEEGEYRKALANAGLDTSGMKVTVLGQTSMSPKGPSPAESSQPRDPVPAATTEPVEPTEPPMAAVPPTVPNEYPEEPATEQVNSPSHYQPKERGAMETIDVIRAQLGDKGTVQFCQGNVIKYMARTKGTHEQDLRKALWYLAFAYLLDGGGVGGLRDVFDDVGGRFA